MWNLLVFKTLKHMPMSFYVQKGLIEKTTSFVFERISIVFSFELSERWFF